MIIPNHNFTARERTVCDLLAPLANVRRLLNVGMRRPGDPRNLWWINICKANGTETHVLEVFEPNCQELRAAGIVNVTCGDVRDVGRIYDEPFDGIVWWHGPEHLEKAEVPVVIDELWQLTHGILILGCPLGNEPQGTCYGNQHEQHLSTWEPDELAALGLETRVVHDERAYPHITAWRTREGEVESGVPVVERGVIAGCVSTAQDESVLAVPADVQTDVPEPHPLSSVRLRRILLVFDDRPRPETTGVYVRRALEQMLAQGDIDEIRHVRPDDAGSLAGSTFDLVIVVDDGLDYPMPSGLGPVVYWAIDTHIDFDRSLRRSRQAEFVFTAQRDGAERLRNAGVPTARWLPLACDAVIHGKQDVSQQYDVAFVGNLFPGPRTDLVRLLQQCFHNTFVGNAYFEDMARVYSASKIVFNRSVANDVNMRVFEALASGSLLITNDLSDNGQHELFRDGVHLVTYRDSEELLDKLRYYLRHDELRERVSAAGLREVLGKHTYAHRVREMLGTVSQALTERATSRLAGESEKRLATSNGRPAPATKASSHDPSYYDFARPEILALIPSTAGSVLEIGCGHGALGQSLKVRQPCEVIGIEIDKQAAEVASGRLDKVFTGDIEQMELDLPAEHFDAVVCGDVLEHLQDPAKQLVRLRNWLKPEGVVVASIPNVRNHAVVKSLLDGNWTYEPAGLLDETHLHFYTRRNINELFERAGYEIVSWAAVPDPAYDEWVRQGQPGRIDLGRIQLADLPGEEVEEFFIYQWLVTARPATTGLHQTAPGEQTNHVASGPSSTAADTTEQPAALSAEEMDFPCSSPLVRLPSCLLLMVTYNRLENTKLALESVLALDYPGPMEIVIFDNASTDGTVPYLRERLRGEPRVRLIESPVNRGIVDPMNAVWFSDHKAELLAKVDNDTVVPPGLFRRLAECHLRSKRFGVLSGFHFRAEGEALVEKSMIEVVDGVSIVQQQFVGGCAVMVKKADLDRIGPISCLPQPAAGSTVQPTAGNKGPFMDSGWTFYQGRMSTAGMIHGYPFPLIHVEHLEDTRSPLCVRSAEHEAYKQALRGMSLEESTEALCVWRPHRKQENTANGDRRETRQCDVPCCPMSFTQDFRRDFDQFKFFGQPFAFARFADGERAICMGLPIQGADGWSYAGGSSPRQDRFREALLAALRFNDPCYYLGLSDGCCDPAAKEWYLREIAVPMSQVTFSNLFVNANYSRFSQIDFSRAAVVASQGGDYWVPEDAMNSDFDTDRLVERLLRVDRTILVSAGPAAAIIIHRYWQRANPARRQVIVDVGSAIDEWTKGRKTRQYQVPGTRTAELVCTW